jgi:uncharacterized membrane protein YfcA
MATVTLGALAFGVALLTLFSGFGLGTLLMPAFAVVLPIEVAVAATAVVHLANNLFKAGLLAGGVDRAVALWFGLPAVAASFAGALLLTALSAQDPVATWSFLGRTADVTPLELVMGALIIGFALMELMPSLRAFRAPPAWLSLGGLVSGFFGGLSGHQGALRAAFLSPLGLSPRTFASTQAAMAVLVDGARLVVYGWSFTHVPASATMPWRLIGVATACAFVGSFAGARLLHKVTIDGLRLTVGALLVVVGVAMIAGLG